MPLSPAERSALMDAVAISNAVIAGGGSRMHVATALTMFAQIIVSDDPCARHALALEMMSRADELMGLHCINLDEAVALRNGHAVID